MRLLVHHEGVARRAGASGTGLEARRRGIGGGRAAPALLALGDSDAPVAREQQLPSCERRLGRLPPREIHEAVRPRAPTLPVKRQPHAPHLRRRRPVVSPPLPPVPRRTRKKEDGEGERRSPPRTGRRVGAAPGAGRPRCASRPGRRRRCSPPPPPAPARPPSTSPPPAAPAVAAAPAAPPRARAARRRSGRRSGRPPRRGDRGAGLADSGCGCGCGGRGPAVVAGGGPAGARGSGSSSAGTDRVRGPGPRRRRPTGPGPGPGRGCGSSCGPCPVSR